MATKQVRVNIPEDLLEHAERRYPSRTTSEIVRLALARLLKVPEPKVGRGRPRKNG